MKITTLIENSADEENNLINEHGLAVFIETDEGNILFDTGKTGAFIDNAEKLNIDLSSIKALVLSHPHYDHCGGVKRLLEDYNIKPEIIISDNFFKNSDKYHYSDGKLKTDFSEKPGYKYVGIEFDENYLKEKDLSLKFVKDNLYKINDQVYVFTNFKKKYDFEKQNVNMKVKVAEDRYIVDPFIDEIAIGLKTEEGIVVLLGCAHPGFLNIISSIAEYSNEKIAGVIGGTHLVEADEERIEKSIQYLNSLDLKMIGLSHCTGENAVKAINSNCKNTFINRTGTVVEF